MVIANKTKPVIHKKTSWNVADKNFHYQSYPYEYKGVRFIQYRIHAPQTDGTTRLKIETNFNLRYKYRSGNSLEMSVQAATEAVRRLLKKSPQNFPPQTKIVKGAAFIGVGGYPRITFNRAFADAKWWKDHKRAKTALTALVQTALETQDHIWPLSGDDSLTIDIENEKPLRLGQFYSTVPIVMYDENAPKQFMSEVEFVKHRKDYENSLYHPRP